MLNFTLHTSDLCESAYNIAFYSSMFLLKLVNRPCFEEFIQQVMLCELSCKLLL